MGAIVSAGKMPIWASESKMGSRWREIRRVTAIGEIEKRAKMRPSLGSIRKREGGVSGQ